MATKNNYKQKWLNALENRREDPKQVAEARLNVLTTNSQLQSDLTLTLQKVSSVTGEVASAARSLAGCFDETREVAGLNFGEFVSEIDNKINSMPTHIVLRRVRDILKVSEMRVGVISARAEELYEANQQYASRLARIEHSNRTAKRVLLATDWIGPNPTEREIDDFEEAKVGEYYRDDLRYEDIDEQWIEHNLFAGTVLKEPALIHSSDDDSDAAETQVKAMSVLANRRAQVVPKSFSRYGVDDLN